MVLEGNMQAEYTYIFHCCYSPQTEGLSNPQEIISTSSLALKQPHLALFLSSFRGCRINMAASPLSGPWTHPRSLASKELNRLLVSACYQTHSKELSSQLQVPLTEGPSHGSKGASHQALTHLPPSRFPLSTHRLWG